MPPAYNRACVGAEAGWTMPENPLVGYWKLISCDALRTHGTRVPAYGRNPVGRLYYDAAGNMSVQIMQSGRPRHVPRPEFGDREAASGNACDGYQAYFSSYTLDAENGIIRHEVLGSLIPGWTGTTQVRYYELQGRDRLVLRTAPFGEGPSDGPIFELVWQRVTAEVGLASLEIPAFAHR